MKVRELLEMVCSKDVMIDYSDTLYIAYEGPNRLTVEGKKHFKSILDNKVIFRGKYYAVIHCENVSQDILLIELFNMLAGYSSVEKHSRYVVNYLIC